MKPHLRYIYNPAFFERLCPVLNECIPGFDEKDFIFRVFNNAWPDMELQARTAHIATVLSYFLPEDLPAATSCLHRIIQSLRENSVMFNGIGQVLLCIYLQPSGQGYAELSERLLGEIRQPAGSRFADELPAAGWF